MNTVRAESRARQAKRVLLKDVATIAGVSMATASRALRENSRVTESMRLKVRDAAAAVGYKADPWARALAQRSSRMVGFYALPYQMGWTYKHAAVGATKAISSHGYNLCLSVDYSEAGNRRADIHNLIHAGYFDGLIVCEEVPGSILADVHQDGVPCVRILGDVQQVAGVRLVTEDAACCAELAVQHLIGLGHKYIAGIYIGQVPAGHEQKVRNRSYAWTRGYLQALTKAQLPIVFMEDPLLDGDAWVDQVFRLCPDTTAIVTQDVDAARMLRPALQRRGLQCPRDISIICANESGFRPQRDSIYTTVNVDYETIGRIGAEALVGRLAAGQADGEWSHVHLVRPVGINDLGTTAPPSGGDG